MSNAGAMRRKHRRERSARRQASRGEKFTKTQHLHLAPGGLEGWHANESEAQRHSAIHKAIRTSGYATTIRRLNVLANLDENRAPGVAAKARADMHWAQQTHGPSEREY